MGQVKDIYMHYAMAADEFVGHCQSLLQLLQTNFGSSPPHFGSWVGEGMIKQIIEVQFPQIHLIDGFGRLCQMCLASTMYH